MVPPAHDQTYAAVAIAPKGLGGKPIDVVRTALGDPKALDKIAEAKKAASGDAQKGIVVDPGRKKVFADGENTELTYKEFELLQYLIEHEGSTISRREIIDVIWNDGEGEVPNDRTIDVHVRRLRAKIAGYEDIIRTVRGGGYRFDKHPEVIYEI
jgi:DNA-binding response OmpR family regulator